MLNHGGIYLSILGKRYRFLIILCLLFKVTSLRSKHSHFNTKNLKGIMFLISDERKFIFFHIPRTGGTSIEKTIRPYSNLVYRYDFLYHLMSRYLGERAQLLFFQSHVKAHEVQQKIPPKIYVYNTY